MDTTHPAVDADPEAMLVVAADTRRRPLTDTRMEMQTDTPTAVISQPLTTLSHPPRTSTLRAAVEVVDAAADVAIEDAEASVAGIEVDLETELEEARSLRLPMARLLTTFYDDEPFRTPWCLAPWDLRDAYIV